MNSRRFMNRRRRGISEYVSVILLILITLAGMALVIYYTQTRAGVSSAGLIQQQDKLGYQAGEIVRSVLSEPYQGGTLFLVEDVGNLPVTINQCFASGQPQSCTLETPPPQSNSVNPPIMQPGVLYGLYLSNLQCSNDQCPGVEIYTSNGVLVEVVGSGSGSGGAGGPAEYAFGTQSYQGQTYLGMTVLPFPLSPLNNNNVNCGSPYDTQGYTAVALVYFTDPHPTVSIVTDDGMEVFIEQAGSNNWQSVFNGAAWHGQGATGYQQTLNVQKNKEYEIAVQWFNACAPGMSALQITNSNLATAFSVTAWEWTLSSNPSYQLVSLNPSQPPQGATVEATGTWG